MKIIIILIINKCKLLYIIIDNKISNIALVINEILIIIIILYKISKYNIK